MIERSIPPPRAERLDVLVVATHATEFAALANHLGTTLTGTLGGVRVACKAVGIGAVVAAAATAKRIVQLDPRAVVLTGSASLYPGRAGWHPGDVAVVNSAIQWDLAASEGRSTPPPPMRLRAEVDAPLARCLHELGGGRIGAATVASPPTVTQDPVLGERIARETSADLEHLEAFAVLATCNWLQVPAAAMFGLTAAPHGGGFPSAEARRNASRLATDRLAAWLHRGAPGVPHAGA